MLAYRGREITEGDQVHCNPVWKDHVEMITNEENDWDHNVERDAVEVLVDCVSREEVLQALNKNWKSPFTFRCIIGVDCR